MAAGVYYFKTFEDTGYEEDGNGTAAEYANAAAAAARTKVRKRGGVSGV
jgi:hypothetical protein